MKDIFNIGDKDVYTDIINHNGDAAFSDLCLNKEDAVKIYNYLIDIGIVEVFDLLIYEMDIFLNSFDEFKEMISKYDEKEFVKKVNDDFFNIEDFIK